MEENVRKTNEAVEYIKKFDEELPEIVKNCILDAGEESNIPINEVFIYFSEDLETFEEDLTLKRSLQINVSDKSSGIFESTYTYYNKVDYAYSEDSATLYNGDKLLDEIINETTDRKTALEDPSDYAVVLKETVTWGKDIESVNRDLNLYIFCPILDPDAIDDSYQEDQMIDDLNNDDKYWRD